MTAEQKSLGQQVEGLLSWLEEMETEMDGGKAGIDKTEKDRSDDQLAQQLKLCKVSYLNMCLQQQENILAQEGRGGGFSSYSFLNILSIQ